jgi:hypothetical protein
MDTESKGAEMTIRTICMSASINPSDVVVPAGAVGEICGTGYEQGGQRWVAVDFGNVMCDLPMEDLEPVSWSEVGSG